MHTVYITKLALTSEYAIGLDKQVFKRKTVNIFLPISFNVIFW